MPYDLDDQQRPAGKTLNMSAFEMPVPIIPNNVSGDGVVGIADLLAVIAAWGPCLPPCPADIDANGVVNIADLLLVVANWG